MWLHERLSEIHVVQASKGKLVTYNFAQLQCVIVNLQHLHARNGWRRPSNKATLRVHLMIANSYHEP